MSQVCLSLNRQTLLSQRKMQLTLLLVKIVQGKSQRVNTHYSSQDQQDPVATVNQDQQDPVATVNQDQQDPVATVNQDQQDPVATPTHQPPAVQDVDQAPDLAQRGTYA